LCEAALVLIMTELEIAEKTHLIEATRGWGKLGLGELWQYRELIYFLFWRDIRSRYRQMALGPLWIIIRPLLTMVVFTVIFGMLIKVNTGNIPYPLFSYSAIIPWTYFSAAVNSASMSLVQNLNLVSKVYFPRLVVLISSVLSPLFDLLIAFIIFLIMMPFYGFLPRLEMLTLPLFVLLAIATGLMTGVWLSAFTVKYRDVGFGINFLLTALQYLSPVVYPASLLQLKWQFFYYLNPVAIIIDGFRWALLGSPAPPIIPAVISSLAVLMLLILGTYIFRRAERTVVDLL
jgi:lipopolysaccharide transport system permease protein